MIICDICKEMGLLYEFRGGHICRRCFLEEIDNPTVDDFFSLVRQGWLTVAEEYLEIHKEEIDEILNEK